MTVGDDFHGLVLIAHGRVLGGAGPRDVSLKIGAPEQVRDMGWRCTYQAQGLNDSGTDDIGEIYGDTPYQAFNLACAFPWLLVQPAPLQFQSWQLVPSDGVFGAYLEELQDLLASPPSSERMMAVANGEGESISVVLTRPVFMPRCGQWTVLLRAPARVVPDQAITAEAADLALLLALEQIHALAGRPRSNDLPEERE